MSENDRYGEFVSVGKIESDALQTAIRDPSERHVGLRQGLTLRVVDTAPDEPRVVASFPNTWRGARSFAVHPNGRWIAERDREAETVQVRSADDVLAESSTETSLPSRASVMSCAVRPTPPPRR